MQEAHEVKVLKIKQRRDQIALKQHQLVVDKEMDLRRKEEKLRREAEKF